jgi:hypothetical protein
LYLPVWEIYSALFRTTITQLKRTEQKNTNTEQKVSWQRILLVISVLLFCPSHHLMHAAADVF